MYDRYSPVDPEEIRWSTVLSTDVNVFPRPEHEVRLNPEQQAAVLEAVQKSTGHIWTNPVRLSLDAVSGVLAEALAAAPGSAGNEQEVQR